jgi:uncharacterized protein (DUF885 family)
LHPTPNPDTLEFQILLTSLTKEMGIMMKPLLTLLPLALLLTSCTQQPTTSIQQSGDADFKKIHDQYVVEFLRRNPTVNTYLGGAGLDPTLKEVEAKLRDHSTSALQQEDRWLSDTQKALEGTNPTSLSAANRINREVAVAQVNFLLHQHQVRRHQEPQSTRTSKSRFALSIGNCWQ